MTLLHWCKINSTQLALLTAAADHQPWRGTASGGGGTPIIVKINDDKKKLVGCEDSISKTHGRQTVQRHAALIHGLIAKEICDYRHTGVVAIAAP